MDLLPEKVYCREQELGVYLLSGQLWVFSPLIYQVHAKDAEIFSFTISSLLVAIGAWRVRGFGF